MKHYPHHIGDFDRATRHLSRIERSIYRDLIELYYDTEMPLTLDRVALCRLILAKSNEESTAVEQTLNEFFNETPTGWYHERCEDELDRYRANSSAQAKAGKASAEARRLKHQQALNKTITGVQHAFNGRSTDVQQTLTERSTPPQPTGNQSTNQPINLEPINLEPSTEQLNPSVNLQKANTTALMSGKPDVAAQIIAEFNAITGRAYRCAGSTRKLITARIAEGFTPADLVAVVRKKFAEWGRDDKMSQYLRPETLFNATKFSSYVGQLNVETYQERQQRVAAEFLGEPQHTGETYDA